MQTAESATVHEGMQTIYGTRPKQETMARATDDLDFALALSLQDQFDQEEKLLRKKPDPPVEVLEKTYDPKSIVDQHWELTDPNPNIHDLFVRFDAMFFDRVLTSSGVAVKWSNRMTLCAGTCAYEGRGGLCSITLSQPLLKLRPRKDLVETLLHEMIHAYLFVTQRNTDHDGHGPQFQSHMHRINKLTGANITIYHSFHDELQLYMMQEPEVITMVSVFERTFHIKVNVYRQHWWKCNGPCQHRPPYFGIVKRAMNRAPSPRDFWWKEHQRTCGGTYTKIKEPDGYGQNKREAGTSGSNPNKGKVRRQGDKGEGTGSRDIKDMFTKVVDGKDNTTGQQLPPVLKVFEGTGHKLGQGSSGSSTLREKMLEAAEKRIQASNQRGVKSVAGTKRKMGTSGQSRRSHDIRDFTSTNILGGGRPVVKRPKLSLTDSDCILLDPLSSHSTQTVIHSSTPPYKQSSSSGDSSSNDVIDLSEDFHRENPITDLISLDSDEDDDGGLKMCPVCGRTDIPAAIINAHVAFCLEEEEESTIVGSDHL